MNAMSIVRNLTVIFNLLIITSTCKLKFTNEMLILSISCIYVIMYGLWFKKVYHIYNQNLDCSTCISSHCEIWIHCKTDLCEISFIFYKSFRH